MLDDELNSVFQLYNLLSQFVHFGGEVFVQFHRVLLLQQTVQWAHSLFLRGNMATTALIAAVFDVWNTMFVNLHLPSLSFKMPWRGDLPPGTSENLGTPYFV